MFLIMKSNVYVAAFLEDDLVCSKLQITSSLIESIESSSRIESLD